jgi:hypothetical protein
MSNVASGVTLNERTEYSCSHCGFVPDDQSVDGATTAIAEHLDSGACPNYDPPDRSIEQTESGGSAESDPSADGFEEEFISASERQTSDAPADSGESAHDTGGSSMSDSGSRDRDSGQSETSSVSGTWLESNVDELGAIALLVMVPIIALLYNLMGVPHGAFDEATVYGFYAALGYIGLKRGGKYVVEKRQG